MASFPSYKGVMISLAILLTFIGSSSAQLHPDYYNTTCPRLLRVVTEVLKQELANDPRMGASLLRLHFHDCFVNGCDGSVLLKDTSTFTGEQSAAPNLNSIRGFEVIERIKKNVNSVCKNNVVSCADILALAARESVVQLRGPGWKLELGRRDSKTASKTAAVNNLPSTTSSLTSLIRIFKILGFTSTDLVALSGAHTIGQAQCTNYRSRIYNEANINSTFAQALRNICPKNIGTGDNKLAALDPQTPIRFDNRYYANLIRQKGLLHTDQELMNINSDTKTTVFRYFNKESDFFNDFSNAMNKMSRLSPLTGRKGEIRSICSKTN